MKTILRNRVLILIVLMSVLVAGMPILGNGCKAKDSALQHEIATDEQSLKANPNDVTNLSALANLYLQNGQFDQAIQKYNKILSLQKDNVDSITGLGMAYMWKGNKSQARNYFNQVLKLTAGTEFENIDKDVELTHYYLGSMNLDDKRYNDAITEFQKALQINPTNADTLYMLGKAQYGANKIDEALDSYNQAVSLVPDYVEVYHDMSKIYAQQGKQGEKDYADGMVLLFQKKYDSAIDLLTRATNEAPELSNAWFGLGWAWEKKGSMDKALAAYTQALKADPNNMVARAGLARVKGSSN